jgi:glycine/D-amino acid oxidase-like deaminating enzyme/nitrite reductase/ring-hydroxylating ferredoxin subunit
MGTAYFDAHSYWQRIEKPLYKVLGQSRHADVCVVGAGIAGLTTAYMLRKAGFSVVVLDRERLGLGETGLTSAHLSNALDEGYMRLIRQHGLNGARQAAESHSAAIELIEDIQEDEEIACDFKRLDGFLFLGATDTTSLLLQEREACFDAGLLDVQLLSRAETDLFDTGPCLQFPDQAQLHPLKYLTGLADAATRRGVDIYTHTEVTQIRGGSPARVTTRQGYTIDCDAVVVATNSPINNKVAVHTKNAAYRSYLIALPVRSAYPQALFWDTEEPYHYLRFIENPDTDEHLLLIGGDDHRTGHDTDPERHFQRLRDWSADRLNLDRPPIARWSGQIMEPLDGLAYIGKNPMDHDNVYVVTGDSGHGMTHASIAGLMLPDLILKRDHPWSRLYDPSRLYLNSIPAYMKEAAQSTAPYGDWLSEGDVDSSQKITMGEGAVLREGLHKVAVYKDELGRLHSCSATCTHLGGVVRWNSAEKTWDCPCHGSRFDRYGQVINGPAVEELSPVLEPGKDGTVAIGN